jgi:hypothetical protein
MKNWFAESFLARRFTYTCIWRTSNMRIICFFGAAVVAVLSVSTQANAQGLLPVPPISVTPILTGSVIGPDGTYYALVPSSTSTRQAPVTELMAISVTGATKWTANLNGDLGQVLAGTNDVYVVQTTTSGSGRSTTITTSVLVINALTGTAEKSSPLTPTGNISEIQIKTVGPNDYLYINSVSTTSSTSGGTTTLTTTQTLSIYMNGTLVKMVAL